MNLLENLNFTSDKIIEKENLLELRGGSEYLCCKLVCFGEQWSCDLTGTGDCGSVELPDESCTIEPIDCELC